LEDKDELQILEEDLYGINNTVSKVNERLEIVEETNKLLNQVKDRLIETKEIAMQNYDTQYNLITENIIEIKNIAKNISYEDLSDFTRDVIIPQGAISYNFNNINYNSLIMSLPKTPPISQEELKEFLKEINSKHSNVLLQISQLKSYKTKLEMIKEKLSITALACYLSS
jgi:hypothetical protein